MFSCHLSCIVCVFRRSRGILLLNSETGNWRQHKANRYNSNHGLRMSLHSKILHTFNNLNSFSSVNTLYLEIIRLQEQKNKVTPISSDTTFVLLQDLLVFLPVGSPLSLSSSIPSSLAATPPSPAPLGPPGSSISSGMNANALPFYPTSETVESVVGK